MTTTLPEAPESEAEILRRARATLSDRLPPSWTMTAQQERPPGYGRADAVWRITAPDGRAATFVVAAKRFVDGRDVPSVLNQLETYIGQDDRATGLLVARYLSPQVRASLTENGTSYVDATGNMNVNVASPGLLMSDRGADGDPWRGPGRPRGTLKGAPAARVIRALADIAGPWSIRELVDVAGVSTGAGYRVIDFLEREGLAERLERGSMKVPRWDKALRRWSEDYGFVRDSQVTRWIAPRGLGALTERLASIDPATYAVTGTLAAASWSAYAPARSAMIYTRNADTLAAAAGLKPADAGANVLLAEPSSDVPFLRTLTNESGVQIAAPTQVVVDLMTGPGRSPQEAEELLQWMMSNEQSWRT
ncbi:MAG: type IV toxin-antitoxin system AbiEi family antitoxin [Lapillicoccus sp.]